MDVAILYSTKQNRNLATDLHLEDCAQHLLHAASEVPDAYTCAVAFQG